MTSDERWGKRRPVLMDFFPKFRLLCYIQRTARYRHTVYTTYTLPRRVLAKWLRYVLDTCIVFYLCFDTGFRTLMKVPGERPLLGGGWDRPARVIAHGPVCTRFPIFFCPRFGPRSASRGLSGGFASGSQGVNVGDSQKQSERRTGLLVSVSGLLPYWQSDKRDKMLDYDVNEVCYYIVCSIDLIRDSSLLYTPLYLLMPLSSQDRLLALLC